MSNTKQVIIQKRIEDAMTDQFKKLMEENKDDILLNLLIEDKIDDFSIEKLKRLLEE